jgi:hypothetical protein
MEKCHEAYAEWLKSLVDGAEPFALSVLVAVGFVKIVTNCRIYEDPTPRGCSRDIGRMHLGDARR